jgi:hypothetical protein
LGAQATGPSLLFEIVFSSEVMEARRVATAKAVLGLLRNLKLQVRKCPFGERGIFSRSVLLRKRGDFTPRVK